MGVSQDFFLSTLFLSLSRPLNRTVTMLFLPRLPLLLAIIFLGLFCLPHTIKCQDPPCEGFNPNTADCGTEPNFILNETCWHNKKITCLFRCDGTDARAVFLDDECNN